MPSLPLFCLTIDDFRSLSTRDYHLYSDETLETLSSELEDIIEKHPDGLEFDLMLAVRSIDESFSLLNPLKAYRTAS